ncbi:cytochrome P450 [Zopfia rhizophila CBS 207.26]|uniref:Cytochrome P450 n=1 Tax=Zopfia rhizophila CBS 207.26 TaxID=1314779 RepID=A0A6A6DH73_9PEZI|nr:cytochrome P450 [Zopfia rhizophila CBS 207.26]
MSDGQPYEVFAPDSRYLFVSSPKHIKELDSAPDTVLSLQAASKQMLQPRYTMHGFNWFDRRGTEGVGFVRALRTMLTNNLPQLLPDLGHPLVSGKRHSPVYPMIVKLTVLTNAFSFFGKDLAKNEEFLKYALAYIEDTIVCAEIMRVLPSFIAPAIGSIIASRLQSHKVIFNALLPVAEERCRQRDLALAGQAVPQHADCIQWIMQTSPKDNPWTPKRIVHELMAIWFGSVHALSTTITFAIQDLCMHSDYVEPLRKELEGAQYTEFEKTSRGLPLLDSFIRESARLTPVESQSTRRCALQPFTLSDGSKLNVGDWACTPVRAIMQDPRHYPSPLDFNGFRFADPAILDPETSSKFRFPQPSPSRLIDANETYHVWGPGRYYAAAVMKVILAQIIVNYDCDLVHSDDSRWITWRSSMIPKGSTKVVFIPRNQ